MKVTIISAIYDNYDVLKEPITQLGVDVNWVCVTDNPDLSGYFPLNGHTWEVVYEPSPGIHPNRAAKVPKCLPWRYTDADYSIWIDASYRVTSPRFALQLMEHLLIAPIAQFKHPWRNCAYDEAVESVRLKKYDGQPCLRQVERYREKGFPPGAGLWATGVIARQHTPEIRQFGIDWLYECTNWSFQDQLSHPFCLWENDLRPVPLPGNHLTNQWLSYEGSGRH